MSYLGQHFFIQCLQQDMVKILKGSPGYAVKAPKSKSAKSNNRNRNRRFRLFDYEVKLSINNRQKNVCSQRNKRLAGPYSPFFLYTTRLHQFTNTASQQLWLGTLINSEQLVGWSDNISLMNQEHGYKVPFLSISRWYQLI